MVSAADLVQLWQVAPWLAVGLLSLVAAAWVFRQNRKSIAATRDVATASATRQGKRLGDLEKAVGLLDLRRRQVEWELLELGVRLPYWPADGPAQPRPRDDEDQADAAPPLTTEAPRPPVPPRRRHADVDASR